MNVLWTMEAVNVMQGSVTPTAVLLIAQIVQGHLSAVAMMVIYLQIIIPA